MKKTLSIAIAIAIFSPGLATIASAQNDSAPQTKNERAPFDSTCVSTALQTREDGLYKAFSKFSTTQLELLATRKAALVAALSQPTARERADARKAAHITFRTASRANHTELKTARKALWDAYKSSATQCKGGRAELAGDVSARGSITESL